MKAKGPVPQEVSLRPLVEGDYKYGELAYVAFTRARTTAFAQGEEPFETDFTAWLELDQELRDAWAWSARAVRARVFRELG